AIFDSIDGRRNLHLVSRDEVSPSAWMHAQYENHRHENHRRRLRALIRERVTCAERRVGKRRNRGYAYDDEASSDPSMARVASRGKSAIGFGELRAVLGFDAITDGLDGICGIGHELRGNTRGRGSRRSRGLP